MNKELLIEKYLNGTLSPQEIVQFNSLIATETDFAKEVQFQENLQQAVITSEDKAFKKKLQEFEPVKAPRRKFVRTMLIAASFAILFSVGYSLLFSKPSHERLFAKNFEAYPNVVNPIVRGENLTDVETLAFTAYENENYDAAAKHFANQYHQTKDAHALFYGGISELVLKNTSEAQQLFLKYLGGNDSQFTTEATWYLSLTYIKKGDVTSAKELLKVLETSDNDYAKKAKDLLSQLK